MYRGKAAGLLKGIDIGDKVMVKKGLNSFTGILMPRNELADDLHIVLKLESGYNIGIRIDRTTSVGLLEKTVSLVQKKEKEGRK